MAGINISKFMKSQKKKSFAALSVTITFCILHLLLWLCIVFRIGWHAPKLHRHGVPAHVAISQLSTVGSISDSICILVTFGAMFGLTRDYKGRIFLFIWVIFMVFYLIFEALLNCCFLYWSVENKQLKFVLISTIVFWLGRSFILTISTMQVMARFYELIRVKEENQPPTIIVTGTNGDQQTVRNPAYKPKPQRSVSVTTVSSTISNLSNPDEYCEKQYPGFLPMSINYEYNYPYTFDDDLYDPQFLQYIIDSYPENQQSATGASGTIVSPSYEEATNGPNLCPPPYNVHENLPPSYNEGDANYTLSARRTDNTPSSTLLDNQH
ncbi:uncharacterized protein LOC115214337 [Octopus sinensis]|uniref:Uncharacterized protein LOC115214337 n=1 Tax=Octopus sinensis TaxID=2607531 RepID=A0A6P7SM61_9MOLL|nr:uncharacterized protein LOC115214337 [Octopus sinensis]